MENFSSQGGPQAAIGPDKRENLPHGDESFPCACYLDHYEGGRSFYPWHWHDEVEIAYVTVGQVAVFVSGGRLLLGRATGCSSTGGCCTPFPSTARAKPSCPTCCSARRCCTAHRKASFGKGT